MSDENMNNGVRGTGLPLPPVWSDEVVDDSIPLPVPKRPLPLPKRSVESEVEDSEDLSEESGVVEEDSLESEGDEFSVGDSEVEEVEGDGDAFESEESEVGDEGSEDFEVLASDDDSMEALQRILLARDDPEAAARAAHQDPLGEFDLDLILHEAIEAGASDVHLTPHDYVAFTVLGDIVRQPQFGIVTPLITGKLLFEVTTNVLEHDFAENAELDTSYTIEGGPSLGRRARLSIGKSFEEIILNFRIISDEIPSPEDLGVSGTLLEWASLPNGLVLMNGPTGTGKALPLSAPLRTPDGGVIAMGDVRLGTELVDSNGVSCSVTSLSQVNNTPRLFRMVLGDGVEVLSDRHHQWWVSIPDWGSSRDSWERFRNVAELATVLRFSGLDSRDLSLDEFCRLVSADKSLRVEFPSCEWVKSALRFSGVELRGDHATLREFLHGLLCKLFYRLTHLAGFGSTPFGVEDLMCFTTEELDLLGDEYFVEVPRLGGDFTALVGLERIYPGDRGYEPALCVSVDSPDQTYVCYDDVITHNSTTLASIVKRKQELIAEKIITVERPIEYVFGTEGKGLVWQREVGRDTWSFANALKSAMRQAPDTIMIGEVRDREEIDALLFAAETGHLAISTMHTNSAAATVSRIKSLFVGDEQARVMATLSDVSRGYANQVLLKSSDGSSRFAVREVLEFNPDVSKLLAAGDVEGIRNYQIENGITMEDELVRAVSEGKCTPQEARSKSSYPQFFDDLLARLG